MHLAAGRYFGQESTCGNKIRHSSEEKAQGHADALNRRGNQSHGVEPYPCYWCSPDKENNTHIWHVGRILTPEERELFSSPDGWNLKSETVVINAAEPVFGMQIGEVSLTVHSKVLCAGRPCTIHNPSDHHMVSWPLNWRGDIRIMERLCSHGVGHPDPDDSAFRKSRGDDNVVHGCDGCCSRKNQTQV